MENNLDILNKISRVEAPPFLFTRISQRVNSLQSNAVSTTFKFAFAMAATIILCLNIIVFFKVNNQPVVTQPVNTTGSSYSSSLQNNIYNE